MNELKKKNKTIYLDNDHSSTMQSNYLHMQQQGWKYYTGQKKPRHLATYFMIPFK